MAESPDRDTLPQATVAPKRRARISVVWIIPILAAVVALGIAIQRVLSQGPTITIIFKVAEGLEAGKTVIKYKDVNIGQVTAVELASDYSRVEVTAKIAKSAAALMVEDAKFWVVEPRVTLSGISGLGTLLSGNYIGFEVGKSDKKRRTFTGLDTPPIITGGQPGRQFVLKAENLGSLGIGSPIYYRRLAAGQVVAYELARDGKAVEVKIFVNAPYDQYVHAGTRFWNASGIDVSVGAGGVDVRTQGLVALLAGGLAFETPSFASKAEPAAADTAFTLYRDETTAMKQPDPIEARYVLYFTESLRGLSVGAPVTMLGLPAGEVTAVGRPGSGDGQCSRARGDRVLSRAAAHARESPASGRGRSPHAERPGAPPLPSTPGGAAGAARPTPDREPAHGAALCGLGLFSERPEGEDGLAPGPAGAAGGAEHPARGRGEAREHHREARQAAVRSDRHGPHEDARHPQPDARGGQQGGDSPGRRRGARAEGDAG
jgi:MlaD protein